MRKRLLVMAFVMTGVGLTPSVVAAQTAGRVDAAGGYAWLYDHDADVTFSQGWFASVGADVIGPLGVVGEVTSSTKSQTGLDVEFSLRVLGIIAGPRVAMHTRRARPFAQALFGTTRSTSTYAFADRSLSDSRTFFTMQFGGGVDVPVVPHVAVRLGAYHRMFRADTITPAGPRPSTYQQTQWHAGFAIR
jgi:opacity protein-like surface antigen